MKFLFWILILPIIAWAEGSGHHHNEGMLVAETVYGRIIAAYELDDFDPGHTPELKMETLARLTLTLIRPLSIKNCDVTVNVDVIPQPTGYTTMHWQGWALELIPSDQLERQWVKTFNLSDSLHVKRRIIIRQISSDVITITITDPQQ